MSFDSWPGVLPGTTLWRLVPDSGEGHRVVPDAAMDLVHAIYYALNRGGAGGHWPFHGVLLALSLAVVAAGVALAAAGVGLGISLLVVMLGPLVSVVGHETLGYRHMHEDRQALLADASGDS